MSTLLSMTLDEAFELANATLGFPEDERTRDLRVRCESQVVKETRPFWGNPALFTSQARAPLRTMEGAYVRAVSLCLLQIMYATATLKAAEEESLAKGVH
ncbi:hypothetical protein [Cobetia crustatorum]|uniref:Uncharacterized protein n=1 Tax=Cobetia crustatorum TaxID=553385 RepID=A0A558HXK7_9GAMM|nr:hypothetical protein [Cobetia crustatorum]TVU73845.1 hypothetical protein FQP86_01905 [Cobetia crustatorum]